MPFSAPCSALFLVVDGMPIALKKGEALPWLTPRRPRNT
jgi:hypothetical protein